MRRFARSTSATARSLFVGKSRNRYACEMPARFAISAVGVAAMPRAATIGSAAWRTASRRSSAVERVRVVAGSTGVSMHSLTPPVNSLRVLQLTQHAARIPDRDHVGRDIAGHHAARADHAAAPDRDARAED